MKKEMLEKVLNARKNLIVEGDIASGKTTNVLFPVVDNAIENKESLFILDSREEYINRYFEKLKANNYNTIILNLRDMDKSDGWNPLEYPYNLYKNGQKDKAQEYLEKIGKIMFYENSTQDPFWALTASDFFTGVALALFGDGEEDEVNLNSINNMFNGMNKKFGVSDYITEYFKTKEPSSKSYIFSSPTFLAPKDTKGSILSVARQKLRLYVSREKLSQIMNQTTFSFEEIVSRPTAIFVIARDENRSLNAIVAMFIEQLYAILVDLKTKNKFNFILDNFDVIEKCNDLVDILGSCVARNVKTYIATRSVSELVNIYGSYMPKLCDLVSIENSKVKLIINQVEETFDRDFETVDSVAGSVEYPKLNNVKVKLFDLEKFVKDVKMQQLNGTDFSEFKLEDPFRKDDLLKRIDQKIEQLELKEKLDKMKNDKKIEIAKILEMEYNELTLEETISQKVEDPFWVEVIIKYFKEDAKVSDEVAKILFKDLSKYDDILNEFTKYLSQKTYDLENAIEINGYTAKKIHELNPALKPTGVYSFLGLLRTNPERAEEIIKSGFKNKDSVYPTNNF